MNDLNFWGQNWWQGVGGVIGILGLLVAIAALIVNIRQNRKKKLSYKVLVSTPLLNIGEQVKGDLKITYKSFHVEQINLLQIKLINDGKVPIRRDDFDGPIELELENVKTFFDVGINEYFPENLKLNFDILDRKIMIKSMLLNPSDYFVVKIIFDGIDGKFKISARIEGISALTNRSTDTNNSLYDNIDIFFLTVVVTVATLFLFFLSAYLITQFRLNDIFILPITIIMLFVIAKIISMMFKNITRRKT